jgi:hypothetical protein
MERQNRSRIALGIFLVLIGLWFLLGRIFPELQIWTALFTWPMILVGVGAFLLILGLLVGSPGMAVPAAVVAGIGGILYYQNSTGDWSSWAFAWALIPGFVGIGTLLAGLLGDHPRQSFRSGLNLIVISAILFFIFYAMAGRAGGLSTY